MGRPRKTDAPLVTGYSFMTNLDDLWFQTFGSTSELDPELSVLLSHNLPWFIHSESTHVLLPYQALCLVLGI